MLVREAYIDAIMYEESTLAHLIHHLISERKVNLEDPLTSHDFRRADMQKVTDMITRNTLGFQKINLYSLKISPKKYIFIFAVNAQEAVDYFTNIFQ